MIKRMVLFKAFTGKAIFCTATPLKFEGEDISDCRLMPCFSIVADGWVKNWRQARSNDKIKVVDSKDLKSKTYEQWLESGYQPHQILDSVQRTVQELFRDDKNGKSAREEYEKFLFDEVLREVQTLEPDTVENYVNDKFAQKYFSLLMNAYREKLIIHKLRKNDSFQIYSNEERRIIEVAIRKKLHPSSISQSIDNIQKMIETEQNVPVTELVQRVESMR
jgi:hypothetical protein